MDTFQHLLLFRLCKGALVSTNANHRLDRFFRQPVNKVSSVFYQEGLLLAECQGLQEGECLFWTLCVDQLDLQVSIGVFEALCQMRCLFVIPALTTDRNGVLNIKRDALFLLCHRFIEINSLNRMGKNLQ